MSRYPQSLIYRASDQQQPFRQAEILTGVIQFRPIPAQSTSTIEGTNFKPRVHPHAIIVSQDCDLDWDYTARQNQDKPYKLLNSILFCELYTAQDIRTVDGSLP